MGDLLGLGIQPDHVAGEVAKPALDGMAAAAASAASISYRRPERGVELVDVLVGEEPPCQGRRRK